MSTVIFYTAPFLTTQLTQQTMAEVTYLFFYFIMILFIHLFIYLFAYNSLNKDADKTLGAKVNLRMCCLQSFLLTQDMFWGKQNKS